MPFLFFTTLFVLVPSLASAYIDPSVTTYAIQAVVGVVMAVTAFFAAYGRRMKKKWMRTLKIDGHESKTQEAPLEVTREDLREELRKARERQAGPGREEPPAAPAKEPRHFWVLLCCNLFLALTAAFFLPLEVILLNQKEFLVAAGLVWWFQLLLSLGAALLLTLLMMILPPKAGRIAAAFSLGTGVALWAQAIFMNGGMESLTGVEIRVSSAVQLLNLAAWAVIIAGTVLAVVLFGRKAPKKTGAAMCLLAGALTVMQAVAFVSQAVSADPLERSTYHFLSTEGEFTLGSENNVVEFILDTADESYFNRMLDQAPEMAEELSGWTYYSNTASAYSRTYPAITYLLTGERCWFDRGYPQYVNEAFEHSDFLKRLHAGGTDVRVFTMDPYLVGSNTGDYIANYLDFDYLDFRNLNLLQLENNLLHISLFKGAPYVLKNRFAYYTEWVNSSSFTFQKTDYSHEIDPVFFEEMNRQGLRVSAETPKAYRFYHLMGLHRGTVSWNERLEYTDEWDPVATLRGSFRLIRSYTDRMKELGIYDSATIIVTADHGISGGGEGTLDVTHPLTPLILVKYPGSDDSRPLEICSAPVAHDDLFATVESALGVSPSGTGSGKTLRDFAESDDRVRTYYYTALYTDKDGEVALREYEITGDSNRFENWKPTGNWWDIEYSVNKVSEERWTGE